MLTRNARIRTGAEFAAIFRHGRRTQGEYLTVRAAPSQLFKAGFLIGRKVDARATVRNRLKRQLRAIIRELYPSLSPAAVTIAVKPGSAVCTFKELRDELTLHLRRLDLLTA